MELAEERREELLDAAIRLGLPRPWFLGLPDGEVAANESRASYQLEEILEVCPAGTWCASTWRGDGPPALTRDAVDRLLAVSEVVFV